MDDDSTEQPTLESSFPAGPSALRQNEQVSEELQLLWSLYRKHTPSPDSDRDSGASEATSDGSVQWEKNFIGKLVKVKKHSCLQERTGPASEDLGGSSVKQELVPFYESKQEVVPFCKSKPDSKCDNHQLQEHEDLTPNLNQDLGGSSVKQELVPFCESKQEVVPFCESKPDSKCDNHQLQEHEDLTPNLNQDVTRSPEKCEPSLSHNLSPHDEPSNCHPCNVLLPQTSSHHSEYSNCQLNSSEEAMPKLNEAIMGSLANSQVSSTSDSRSAEQLYTSCLDEYEDTRKKLHNENHQFGDINKHGISGMIEKLPECSMNCHVSSSCDSSEIQGVEHLRPDIGTKGHTSGEMNLGYVSRWMKEPPRSPRHCEVSSSCGSESDDGHTVSHEQNMIESPRNCQVSSSCESDSDASGYSNLCLRVSEDSVEDDTDHSSGKEKRDKSHETSADRKDGDDALKTLRHNQFKCIEQVKHDVIEQVKHDVCEAVPTQRSPSSTHMKKKRRISHPRQLSSNKYSHRDQQWTRDFPYRDRPARLRSQSPTERVGRWRRSQSPVETCRKLRSRSVLPIRDTQHVTPRKRRSKSCDTYSKHKQSHESRQALEECVLLKGIESVSETPSNNGVKRQSRSPRRRWSKSASSNGKYKTSSSSRDKSILQVARGNSESMSVRTATRCMLCNNAHKLQEEISVPASKRALVGRSHMNQTPLSRIQNVSEEQLTSRTRRSLSRSRSISNTARKESVSENIPTKNRRSMSEVHVHPSEKDKPLEVYKDHMMKQSEFPNTSKRNTRTTQKKDSFKDHVTTKSNDLLIQNSTRIFTRLNKCNKLSQEQATFGSKLSIQVSRNNSSADSSKNRKLSSKQSPLKSMCSQTHDSSTKLPHSAPANAFRRNTCSPRSQVLSEEWFTSLSRRSAPVYTSKRQSRLNKFQERQDQSAFSNTHASLMNSNEEVYLSKRKKLSDDRVVDSSCLMSRSTAKRHTESKNTPELTVNTLHLKRFLGFPEEEVSLNSNLSLPTISSESCECPVSTETIQKMRSTSKARHSGSVLTHGTLSLPSKDKMALELLSSSDSKNIHQHLYRKRKLSNEACQSQDKPHTSKSLFSFLSGSCGKETELDRAEDRTMDKYPSHNRCLLLRTTSGGCENQYSSKRKILGKFKQSAKAAQGILQSKQVEVSKKKSDLHQTVTHSSQLHLGHSFGMNEPAAVSETSDPSSKEKSYIKVSGTSSSLFKDANAIYVATASDTTVVKCSSQERIFCKEDNALLGASRSLIKPCSVVLKNILLSSVYEKYVNKKKKFVFPPFPHVTSFTKVSVFCLPQDYINTVQKKGK